MSGNEALYRAKTAKKDEFYTQRADIENELCHYADHFRDKVVYCSCDDPVTSEFWRFFVRNFKPWGLKKLLATHYEPDEKNYSYSLEICEDTNGDGRIDIHDEPTVKRLPCNGDFRSAACIELLQEADIVVTNPPFSLFRDYVAQLMEYGKKFLIIGNMNAITYKEIFPLLKENKMWLGYDAGDMSFKVPDYYEERATRFWVDASGQKWRSLGNACWYTNLDIQKRHILQDLRGNYYDAKLYPHYDNYDAIEVSRVIDIPSDYDGVMGVPITFLDKYCPEQFEIVGLAPERLAPGEAKLQIKRYVNAVQHKKDGSTCGGNKVNDGPTILHDEQPPKYPYYTSETVPGKFIEVLYARILIRRKKGAAT